MNLEFAESMAYYKILDVIILGDSVEWVECPQSTWL